MSKTVNTQSSYYRALSGRSAEEYLQMVEDEMAVAKPCPHILEVCYFNLALLYMEKCISCMETSSGGEQ